MTTTEPVDGAAILDALHACLTRYVILPSAEAVDAVALWIAATHAQPAWAHAPRLVIRAPEKRCGKSRLLDVVEGCCHNPLITVNASPAAVYRAGRRARRDDAGEERQRDQGPSCCIECHGKPIHPVRGAVPRMPRQGGRFEAVHSEVDPPAPTAACPRRRCSRKKESYRSRATPATIAESATLNT